MRDFYRQWMNEAEAELWDKAKDARFHYDLLKNKETPYAKAMLALAIKYAEAAELFEIPGSSNPRKKK